MRSGTRQEFRHIQRWARHSQDSLSSRHGAAESLDDFRYGSAEKRDDFRYIEVMSEAYKQRLKRLPPEFYQGHAWVHWTLAMEGRRTGWLEPKFLYKFCEVLTHAMFRYQVACPIYCLMPDHMHLLWTGLADGTDQLPAMKSFRRDLNDTLGRIGFALQRQPYDHVLKDEELERDSIETVADYIARNPERSKLVAPDAFASYSFTGCLLPGAARLRLFTDNSWDEMWKTLALLKRTECYRGPDPKYQNEA